MVVLRPGSLRRSARRWCWGACSAASSATGAQMYGVVAGLFPMKLSGRVTTCINLMAFVGPLRCSGAGCLDALRAGGMDGRSRCAWRS